MGSREHFEQPDRMLGSNLRWTSIFSRGSNITPSHFMLQKLELSTGFYGSVGPHRLYYHPFLYSTLSKKIWGEVGRAFDYGIVWGAHVHLFSNSCAPQTIPKLSARPPSPQFSTLFESRLLGGAVPWWLVRWSPDRAVRVSPGRGTALCSWGIHFTFKVPLSPFAQVYKWVLASSLLGVTLRWTSIPYRVE